MTVAALIASLGAADGAAAAGGMTAAWWFAGDQLIVALDGPTTGWLAVGFNERPELAGSRLALVAVTDAGAVAEEHEARPPEHPFVRRLEVRAAEEARGRTRVVVAVPTAPARAGGLTLAPGARCGLTLAWSHEDDFGHHSAFRTLEVTSLGG